MEKLLLDAGGAFGFAGLAFVIFIVFFLRYQSVQQAAAEASRKADREMIHAFMLEIVAARGESNRVIESSTAALTKLGASMDEMCGLLEAHDEHARIIGDKIARLESEISLLVSLGPKSPTRSAERGTTARKEPSE